MHDLRKQALLESGKTISRKARSKQGTPSASRTPSATRNSPRTTPSSRTITSHPNSDDDLDSDADLSLSGSGHWSAASSDAFFPTDSVDEDVAPAVWREDLETRIEALCDRKRSSTGGREDALVGFAALLTRHFARDVLRSGGRTRAELVPALVRSVRAPGSEREAALALRALALVVVTDPEEEWFGVLHDPVRAVIADGEFGGAKVAAVHALGVVTFYGAAGVEETADVMEFLLEIAGSDGAVVDETDNAELVVAALEEWGFLASQMEDMEEATEAAMDVFVDQLESVDVGVQVAAGENIALLFEKSYTEAESDDDVSEEEEDDSNGTRMVKRYTVYRQTHHLEQTLRGLAKASSKRVSKRDRKSLHTTFNDVLTTIERPTRGPRYSTAQDPDGREYGSRLRIAIHGGGRMTIDTWAKLFVLNALKRLLQGGFMVHYEQNDTVFDSLPVIVEDG